MIDYDLLDLPEDLVLRFKKWQQRFEEGFDPGSNDPALQDPPREFWENLGSEENALAVALHAVVGGRVQYEAQGCIWTVGQAEPDFRYSASAES